MAQFVKDTFLSVVLAATLWLVYSCSGCAPATLAPARSTAGAQSPAVTGASVVTLIRPEAQWTWGNLASENFTDGGFKVRYVPSCNGFAIEGNRLVTAAHCVTGIEPGGEVRYLSPDGVGHGIATLLSVNEAADLATCEAYGLTPLPVTSVPRDGDAVVAVSSFYGQTSYGKVLGRLSTGYYATSQTIIKGWSGSPVLDLHGRAWGVISQCPEVAETKECEPGHAIVTALQ